MSAEAEKRGPLRSSIMTKGLDRATHRSLFYAIGWHPRHLDKPLVAVVNSFNEVVPGHVHLDQVADRVKSAIRAAGARPGSLVVSSSRGTVFTLILQGAS